jgi:hypothetical protein
MLFKNVMHFEYGKRGNQLQDGECDIVKEYQIDRSRRVVQCDLNITLA